MGHVVELAHSNRLRDFDCFFFDLQDAYVVSVNGLDCCDKFWRGTVSFEDAQQEVVIGRVVGEATSWFHRALRSGFRVKSPSRQPSSGVPPNWNRVPCLSSSLTARAVMIEE